MESMLPKIIEASPLLGVFILLWYLMRKDYIKLVDKVQDENLKREGKYQDVIDKLTVRIADKVDKIEQKVEEFFK